MTVRQHFAAARVRSFVEAADAYVLRVQDDARTSGEGRSSRARVLRRNVMRQLATKQRRHLVYRFCQFAALSHFAGVDPLPLCFDPPVFPREVRTAFATAARGWVTDDGVLRAPNEPTHRVFLAAVPELCCFGFILTEVLSAVAIRAMSALPAGNPDAYADALNRELTRAISSVSTRGSLTDHHSRMLFRLVRILEQVAGHDFSLAALTDDQVLDSWRQWARDDRRTPYGELLRRIAALSAATWASMAENAAREAASVDDPAVQRLRGDLGVPVGDEAIGEALDEALIIELLSSEQLRVATQQLRSMAGLVGIGLSRARATTFASLERRRARGAPRPSDITSHPPAGVSHALTLELMANTVGRLDAFVHTSIYLLWESGRRPAGVRLALEAGIVSGMAAVASLPTLRLVGDASLGDGLELAVGQEEPSGMLKKALHQGRTAWLALRRRLAFADLGANAAALDAMEDVAASAIVLRRALSNVHQQLACAVAPCLDGSAFIGEYRTFRLVMDDVYRASSQPRTTS